MNRRLPLVALTSAALLLTACASGESSDTPAATTSTSNADKTVTLWLAGGDTPDELRTYLKDTFKAKTGATLAVEEQSWGDLVTKLTTALPDAENTPDVVELGNTQSPTFTNVGAFLDISDQYDALGGDKLLPSFVEAGSVDGKKYALPVLLRVALPVHARGRLEGGRGRAADNARGVQRGRRAGSPRRTRATSRTSPASSSVARTGATASPGSSPTAASSPRRRTASGSPPSRTPTPSRGSSSCRRSTGPPARRRPTRRTSRRGSTSTTRTRSSTRTRSRPARRR